VFHPQDASFRVSTRPLFNHLVLADEINRAPAKVQSALLEAMAEHQITVGKKSWRLPPLFMVAATQNPIEQEGTYPLPEASSIASCSAAGGYPSPAMELAILQLNARGDALPTPPVTLSQSDLLEARTAVQGCRCRAPRALSGAAGLRHPPGSGLCPELEPWSRWAPAPGPASASPEPHGPGPGSPGAISCCPKTSSNWRAVLRHRLIPSYQALADNLDSEALITLLLDAIPCP
jgi:MoxR-like ATPase